jgi:hypothetical protein
VVVCIAVLQQATIAPGTPYGLYLHDPHLHTPRRPYNAPYLYYDVAATNGISCSLTCEWGRGCTRSGFLFSACLCAFQVLPSTHAGFFTRNFLPRRPCQTLYPHLTSPTPAFRRPSQPLAHPIPLSSRPPAASYRPSSPRPDEPALPRSVGALSRSISRRLGLVSSTSTPNPAPRSNKSRPLSLTCWALLT